MPEPLTTLRGPALTEADITTGHDARCQCTWAPKDGEMQVKFRNSMCLLHGGFSHG